MTGWSNVFPPVNQMKIILKKIKSIKINKNSPIKNPKYMNRYIQKHIYVYMHTYVCTHSLYTYLK